jgi:hypothetical protein
VCLLPRACTSIAHATEDPTTPAHHDGLIRGYHEANKRDSIASAVGRFLLHQPAEYREQRFFETRRGRRYGRAHGDGCHTTGADALSIRVRILRAKVPCRYVMREAELTRAEVDVCAGGKDQKRSRMSTSAKKEGTIP